MSVPAPHFFLFSESNKEDKQGYWSFALRAADGSATIEAADCEPQVYGERLDLLAVVRGLEALDQPSRVTLVTPSSYVNRGIVYGLDEWGRNGWTWESFGQMVPVKTATFGNGWTGPGKSIGSSGQRTAWMRRMPCRAPTRNLRDRTFGLSLSTRTRRGRPRPQSASPLPAAQARAPTPC